MATTEAEQLLQTANIVLAESMVASAWPALRLSLSGRWLLGMAKGVSGRANCLFFLDPTDNKNVEARLDWMENTYQRAGLPPRVRLSPLAPLPVVQALQKRGYLFQNPTLVLKKDVPIDVAPPHPGFRIEIAPSYTSLWLDTFMRSSPRFEGKALILREMLDSIVDETRYLLIHNDRQTVATAMAVRHLDVMTVQNLVTDPAFRRHGCAKTAMQAIMRCDMSEGVKWFWLAVEANNLAALSLYKGLGFTELYRYIYASKGLS